MESTIEQLGELAKQFAASNGFRPPREVVQALMTLAGDALITNPVTATTQPSQPSSDIDVVWDCMAIAGNVVISLRGTRRAKEWHWSSVDLQEDPPPAVFGSLVPKAEIVGCRLLSVERRGEPEHWMTRWQLQLKNDSIPLPWSANDWEGQQRHEELALALAKLLR